MQSLCMDMDDIRSIFVWLKEHNIDFDAGRMHRDFSDGVKVAQILKTLYPRHIDLNNYQKCNSTNLKIKNWETLNYKILNKIGLHLKSKRITRLAKGKPGAIEALINQIKTIEDEYYRGQDEEISAQEQMWIENDDIVTVDVKRLIDDKVVQTPETLILYSIYEDAKKKSDELSTEIELLTQKLDHLEQLRDLKQEHMNEISQRLARTCIDAMKDRFRSSKVPSFDIETKTEFSSDSSTITGTDGLTYVKLD